MQVVEQEELIQEPAEQADLEVGETAAVTVNRAIQAL